MNKRLTKWEITKLRAKDNIKNSLVVGLIKDLISDIHYGPGRIFTLMVIMNIVILNIVKEYHDFLGHILSSIGLAVLYSIFYSLIINRFKKNESKIYYMIDKIIDESFKEEEVTNLKQAITKTNYSNLQLLVIGYLLVDFISLNIFKNSVIVEVFELFIKLLGNPIDV